MSDSDKWFLEAMRNAVSAGQLTPAGADRVEGALYYRCSSCGDLTKREELCSECGFVCDYCGRDCRDAMGAAAPECRRAARYEE